MVIFSYSNGRFIFVKAYDNLVHIFPGTFSIEQDTDSEYVWNNVSNAFNQDLSINASLGEFNKENSAYILSSFAEAFYVSEESSNEESSETETTKDEIKEPVEENIGEEDLGDSTLEEDELIEPGDLIEEIQAEKENNIINPQSTGGSDIESLPEELPPSIETDTEPTENIPEETSLLDRAINGTIKLFSYIPEGIFNLRFARAENSATATNENNESININPIKQSIIFSDFSVPLEYKENGIGSIKLRLSLGAESDFKNDNLRIDYSTNGAWQTLGLISLENSISNQLNNDYFKFILPSEISWEDIGKLKIRINYINNDLVAEKRDFDLKVFLDALWLEVDYDEQADEGILNDEEVQAKIGEIPEEATQETKLEKDIIKLDLVSNDLQFGPNQEPRFDFQYKKTKKSLLKRIGLGLINLFRDEYKNIKIKVLVFDNLGKKQLGVSPEINYIDEGKFEIDIKNKRSFRPGKFFLKVEIEDEDSIYQEVQEFSWGVLAFNSNKSVYLPDETAFLSLGVLDDNGHTICDAELYVEIEAPDGGIAYLTTVNGLVFRNPECRGDSVIENPDYYANYSIAGIGEYKVKIIAVTKKGAKEVYDKLTVKDSVPFEIERIGPTRIFPLADYEMKIKIKANEDFIGDFIEYVPNDFIVKDSSITASSSSEIGDWKLETGNNEDGQELKWGGLELKKDDEIEITYTFDAPDVSPEFYLLGPIEAKLPRFSKENSSGLASFIEARQWQIAADATGEYKYNAGSYLGTWTTPGYAYSADVNEDDYYAIRDIPKSSGSEELLHFLVGNSNAAPSAGYDINTVNIGIEAFFEDLDANITLYIQPIFNGATGTAIGIDQSVFGTTDTDAAVYREITDDAAGPGDGNWTWSDVQTLDVKVWGWNQSNSRTRMYYVDSIRVQVDYTIPNDPPTGSFNSAQQRGDGTGVVDISIEADDPDDDEVKAILEYEAGSSCSFSSSNDPALDETDGNTTADFGDPKVENDNFYQIGNASGWIETASGSNTVLFDWDSKADVPSGDGIYCLRLTVNDDDAASSTEATSTLIIDNAAPSPPGSLSVFATSGTAVILGFGASTTESNFSQYIIYYKEYDGSSPTEIDDKHGTSSDSNMGYQNYYGAASTTITDLFPSTQYIFNIWAYDSYGNKASATQDVIATTSAQPVPPILSINSLAQKTDGSGVVDISIEVDDGNDDDARVKMEYVAGSVCDFSSSLKPILDDTDVNITADFGDPEIDNNSIYQIGTSSAWIKTASGSNSVLFDWLTTSHDPDLDGTYCVQFTANDGADDQANPATSTLIIDNTDPTAPGALSVAATTGSSITLNFGASSTEVNFSHYIIYYKEYDGANPTEIDSVHGTTSDANMGYLNYNTAATTTISGLNPETVYVFGIWVYDLYGHAASSSAISGTTEEAERIRARTVMFPAGTYSGNGTTGKNSDTNHTFSAFNFRLAESGVDIKNAFIIFEAQFEAYANNSGNYTGYNLAFDSCQETCAADAFSGTGRILKDDNTVLVYDETESNQTRLLLDITNEPQIAAYSGNGVNMEGQVGYRIERGGAVDSIASAKAILVVTYIYNENDSTDITNTVIYPLESNVSGDSGTRRGVQSDDCVIDSTCPLFTYRMEIPEFSTKLSDWFLTYSAVDRNSGVGIDYENFNVDVKIQGEPVSSDTFIYEVGNGVSQSHPPAMLFKSVYGYSENSTSTLGYHATCLADSVNYYLVGGEVFETYVSSKSAATKTRTVSFPIGVINNGLTTSQTNSSVDVYFPENGSGSGIVKVKKAWFRIISSNHTGAGTVSVSSQVGNNGQSGSYVYNYDTDTSVVKPSFNIIHVIPSADYSELEAANASTSKTVTVYTANNSAAQGGISAELMITYTYTSETSGYLTSLNLFAGQSDVNGNAQSATTSAVANSVLPELYGTKTILAGSLLAHYLVSDSDGVIPETAFTYDANIGVTTPNCANAYNSRPDDSNIFTEFYKGVTSVLTTTDSQSYIACYSNNGGGAGTAGAKMNGILIYNYGWTAPPPKYTQNDWRWYENIGAIQPTTPKADENTLISNINLADILRLRASVGLTIENLPFSSQSFRLQYAKGSDCPGLSSWNDVGATTSSAAWRFYDNIGVADESTITGTLLASSTAEESYEESNPSKLNPNTVPENGYGEWDWAVYNYSASSSAYYCFRMILGDGTELDYYNSDGYARLLTASANTLPGNPASLGQFRNNETSVIGNTDWINENNVKLTAAVIDPNINESLSLYFQLILNTNGFITATSEPSEYCLYGTAYESCTANRVWAASSTIGDYRTNPFIATTSITAIPDSSIGYKWQVLACDGDSECSSWVKPATGPNFRVDITPPSPPGNLSLATTAPTSITINFGATTTETNFDEYRIYYKAGSSGVTEANTPHYDTDFSNKYFNFTSSTTVFSLAAGTQYVFNIWAYDLAGNKATATKELIATTSSSLTPPTGSIFSANQKTDGSGAVDIAILVDDPDNDDTLRAMIEYEAGEDCLFSPGSDPTIDPVDVSDSHGSPPDIDNNYSYQVGTTSGWIITSPGPNFVFFDWLSRGDAPAADGTYCLRLTVNDGLYDQGTLATKKFILDNLPPQTPGPLTLHAKNKESVTVNFGSFSSDTWFNRYRIFYSTSTPVTTNDYEHTEYFGATSTSFYGIGSTTISDLIPGTLYYFNIFAYDSYGNSASATPELATSTNSVPINLAANGQFRDDEITVIANGEWINSSSTRLTASVNDPDSSELPTIYFNFILNNDTFKSATTVPSGACVYGTAFGDCDSKVWFIASSSPGDYSSSPYIATTSITNIPNASLGYRWQVLACDDDDDCADEWVRFNDNIPNINIDITAPTSPGSLSEYSKTSRSITVNYGAQTTENNFSEYKIFYSTSSPAAESDSLFASSSDPNLGFKNYGLAATTTITGLDSDTTYYFTIWAYDRAGNKASSSEVSIDTNPVISTPGVIFYTKNDRALYYRVWTGTAWNTEQQGPDLGSAAGDNIRHIRALRSDDGTRIGILAKTWDGANQEWWGTVYRVAADDFVDWEILGSAYNSAANNQLITGCIAALSSGEFFIVRNNNGSNGTLVYSWNTADGWTTENAGPDPSAVVNGCQLVRRPGTDNYLLMTFDDSNHGGQINGDVGSAYYHGGSTYADSWTNWLEHAYPEEDTDNYVGEAFFDPSDNTRGAINYSGSNSAANTKVKKFICDDGSISFYGTDVTSPATWSGEFVHGEFAADPGGTGISFYAGDDINGEVNVYKVDITTSTPSWYASTNGDNISGTGLYAYTNDAQKPYAITFYKNDSGVVAWNESAAATPKYRKITDSTNTVDASDTAIPGSDASVWSRVRIYNDPNENEFVAIYQNTDYDYSAVFWDGVGETFYNDSSGQIWTELVTGAGAADYDDECTSFAFTAGNASPYAPGNLTQHKADASTIITNGSWTNERTVNFTASLGDSDTSEIMAVYLQLITGNDDFATSTGAPLNACASTTPFSSCNSLIWHVATSTAGDYSVNPFIATATIALIPDSGTLGYKWQVKVCDDDDACSSWIKYNVATPNFKVDATDPAPPGQLTPISKTSTSVVLNFGATTTEDNFLEYKIFYSTSTPVTINDNEHSDGDLGHILYNYTTNTEITGLDPSTMYYFKIWAYDEAGNSASSSITSTTTNETYYLTQTSYLLENDDGSDVNNNSAAAVVDAPLSNIYIGERINVRIQIENTGGDTAYSKVYKLKYENQTDNPGTWNDVGAATPISYTEGMSGDSDDIITPGKAAYNANTPAFGYYYDDTYHTDSFSLINGRYTEFVFSIDTGNATAGKTYRLSLYNETDAGLLDSYLSTSTISIVGVDTKRYSKGIYPGLSTDTSDLMYYFDPRGYSDIAIDDSSYDAATSTGNIPVFNFVVGTTTNTDAINAAWNGQSTMNAASSSIVLQVYRFGTTDAWVTMASNSTSSANIDIDLSANINSSLSEYYDGSNKTYWRVYQEAGAEILKSDYFNIDFTPPVPVTAQIHYRWREDNNNEASAAWLEDEDTGSPTASTSLEKGENIRLRIEAVNTGGGSAPDYAYRLEYASTTGNCSTDPGGWAAVPIDNSGHWRMSTSTYVTNGGITTFQLDNSEGYNFEDGFMVEDPSSTSSPITLNEGDYTEVEYVIRATASANSAGTYCFRATNNGASLDSYDIFPVITLSGVSNTAPTFSDTGHPSDNNSASTSPTNYGSLVDFTAIAVDGEGDNYYLAICKTSGITSGDNGPPVCSGGNWCISELASSSEEASCSYTAATSSELLDWYAYACDKYPGFAVAKCSAYSQGSSTPEDHSPFAVNHRPIFTSVSTTDDDKDPGGRFTITTVSSDSDSAGGADTLNLFVCTEDNADKDGCLGATNQTVCFASATSSPNAKCYYQDTIPTPSGPVTYYAFIFDIHDFSASTNSQNSTYNINNVPTVLGDLELNSGVDITLDFKPATTTVQTINSSVEDQNGCTDLVSAIARIYMSNVSGGYNCSEDDNDCYHVSTGGCVLSDCTGDSDQTGIYTCSAGLKHFAVPTDDSSGNPYESYNWLSYIQTYDGANYVATTSPGVEVETSLALEVTESIINFGSEMTANENSGTNNSTTTVVNIGNSPINVGLAGTNMIGVPSGTITVGQIKWSLAENFNYPSAGTPLTLGGIPVDIIAPKPTSDAGVEDKVYWGVGIPEIADASTYTGVNSFSVILDNNNWPVE